MGRRPKFIRRRPEDEEYSGGGGGGGGGGAERESSSQIGILADDRARARDVTNEEELTAVVFTRRGTVRDGAVSRSIREQELTDYRPGGRLAVNEERTQSAAAQLRTEVNEARFYGQTSDPYSYESQVRDLRESEGISDTQARNLIARDYQTRAIAVLAARQAGNVRIDNYTVGVLNQLASGDYEGAVFGEVDRDTGQRQFAQGTRARQEIQSPTRERSGNRALSAAAREDNRRRLIESGTYGGGIRSQDDREGARALLREAAQRRQTRTSTQAPARDANPFADLIADESNRQRVNDGINNRTGQGVTTSTNSRQPSTAADLRQATNNPFADLIEEDSRAPRTRTTPAQDNNPTVQRGLFGEDRTVRQRRTSTETQQSLFTPEEMTGAGRYTSLTDNPNWRGRGALEVYDPRTEEEKEEARRQEARRRNSNFFDSVDSQIIDPPF